MHIVKNNNLEPTDVNKRCSVTGKIRQTCSFNQVKLPLDAFDPHFDRMTRHNLKTSNRF
jgi:hypothetical protein